MFEDEKTLTPERKYLTGLALRISQAREKKFGKSRGSKTRAAQAYGVCLSDWHSLENVRNEPRVSKLLELARFLDVDPGWLMSGDGNMEGVCRGPHASSTAAAITSMQAVVEKSLADPPADCPNRGACLRQARILKLFAGMLGLVSAESSEIDAAVESVSLALLEAIRNSRPEEQSPGEPLQEICGADAASTHLKNGHG